MTLPDAVQDLLPGVRLDHVEQLSDGERASVHRVRARDEEHGERSVIVKQFHGAGEGWVRECAMLACLPPEAPAPRLLAESREPQLAVLTDLGGPARRERAGLAGRLLGADAAAAGQALVGWARALAGLHSATRGLHDLFVAELDARAGDLPVSATPMRGELAATMELLGRHCAALGVAMPMGTSDQLEALGRHVTSGPCALTPHDTCPDNCVEVDGGLTLIDFEGAQWRNIAWDAAYLLVPWPTCWCSWALPDEAAARAVDAYREAAAETFPEVAEREFEAELQTAVVGWALESVTLLLDRALEHKESPAFDGRVMPRRRAVALHRLDAAARTTVLPALAELGARLATELRARWGTEDVLPLAPAFR